MFLILSVINQAHTQQVDFVLAYQQAPIEHELYMRLPKGINTKTGNRKAHVLKFINNLYGQNQAGQGHNKYLMGKILTIGFIKSYIDKCIFYQGRAIFACYVGNGIFSGPYKQEIDQAIKGIKATGLDGEDKGDIEDYLGVNVKHLQYGQIKHS